MKDQPERAYYVLVDAQHFKKNSLKLSHCLIEEANAGVTPGIDFGDGATLDFPMPTAWRVLG